jgi:diaminopropionate ammonia-lyase
MSPLVELPEIAAELGVRRVFLKDESERLGLPAFKILGASWAVAKALALRFGVSVPTVSLAALQQAMAGTRVTLVTATDGNHGRAVSHMARLLGIGARIYTPAGVSAAARDGIRSEGAELVELDGTYDDAVSVAAASVGNQGAELLIQDTSWPGYHDVPEWIVEGYTTLFSEIDEQLAALGLAPDALVVPTGVGSLLQSAVEYYRGVSDARPAMVCVEPTTAACVLASLHAGELRSVDTSAGSIMTGLCTGTPSQIAWPTLRDGLDAAVAVDDSTVRATVNELAGLGRDVGPCGAATLAGVRAVIGDETVRAGTELSTDSVIVLLSTESLSANPLP